MGRPAAAAAAAEQAAAVQFVGARRAAPHRTREEWAAPPGYSWLQLGKCWYRGAAPGAKELGPWEMLRRTPPKAKPQAAHAAATPEPATTAANVEHEHIGAVDILATVEKGGQRWLLLVAVYRPPVDAWSLEFPAGMIDEGETPYEAARRELREETGYHASPPREGEVEEVLTVYADPWKSSEAYYTAQLHVDGDAPENTAPTQNLEADETIMALLVPVGAAMLPALLQLVQQGDFLLEARVAGFAQGQAFTGQTRARM